MRIVDVRPDAIVHAMTAEDADMTIDVRKPRKTEAADDTMKTDDMRNERRNEIVQEMMKVAASEKRVIKEKTVVEERTAVEEKTVVEEKNVEKRAIEERRVVVVRHDATIGKMIDDMIGTAAIDTLAMNKKVIIVMIDTLPEDAPSPHDLPLVIILAIAVLPDVIRLNQDIEAVKERRKSQETEAIEEDDD
jgi:hypothetical protein